MSTSPTFNRSTSTSPSPSQQSNSYSINLINNNTTARTNSIKRSPHLRNGNGTTTSTSPSKNSSPRFINDDQFNSNEGMIDENELVVGDGKGELDKCSREALISMYSRQVKELNQVREKVNSLEESDGLESREILGLKKNLEMANGRIDQLLNDQYRMEEELAGRIEVLDKLRATVRESEREKRDSEKRYREQSESFDAERKAWLDQEAHYNLRISNLSSAPRKARLSDLPPPKLDRSSSDPDIDPIITDFVSAPPTPNGTSSTTSRNFFPTSSSSTSLSTSTGPSLLEINLQEQLNSLTTAHGSLTLTLRALQGELSEIKRVYQDVQEQNESYEIMLGERTLNGEIRGSEILRRSWTQDSEEGDGSSSVGGIGLESVGEDSGEGSDGEDVISSREKRELGRDEYGMGVQSDEEFQFQERDTSSRSPNARRKRRPVPPSKKSISGGGGLDLGAELEAAQMGHDEEGTSAVSTSASKKKHKKEVSSAEDLKAEIKSLKEANKALTLYVSKIVEKICSQEGFEKVLATDYLAPTTPKLAEYSPIISESGLSLPNSSPVISSPPRTASTPTTVGRTPASTTSATTSPLPPSSPPVTASNNKDRSRKTLSLGWDSVSSVFASALSRGAPAVPSPALQPPAGFKPFMLNTATPSAASNDTSHISHNNSSAVAAPTIKKHETDEDEDDRRERERLRAEMTLYGFTDPAWSNESSGLVTGGRTSSSSTTSGARLSPLLGSPNITSSSLLNETTISSAINFRRLGTPSPTFSSSSQGGSPASTNSLLHPSPNFDSSNNNSSSNFTESKPRRQRPLSIARASRSSIHSLNGIGITSGEGGNEDSFGLGIAPEGGGGGVGSSSSSRTTPTTSPNFTSIGLPPVKPEGEDAENWSKKLKRMSLGTWGGAPAAS